MILLLCGIGFGICITILAIGLVVWILTRNGTAIVASKTGCIRWHRETREDGWGKTRNPIGYH